MSNRNTALSITRLCLILIVILQSSQSLAVGFYDGNDLVDWCLDEDSSGRQGRCFGFLMGVVEATVMVDAVRDEPQLCMAGATELNMIQMTFEYANAHPEMMQLSASWVVAAALDASYSCYRDW